VSWVSSDVYRAPGGSLDNAQTAYSISGGSSNHDTFTIIYSANGIFYLSSGETPVYIDPKTLKPCKHCWVPNITETCTGWDINAKCRKCDIMGNPGDKGVSLRKLVKQLGR